MSGISFRSSNPKLKAAILYILEKVPDPKNMGMKKLSKLLYFADFSNYKKFMKPITNEEYSRLEHGPMPRNIYHAVEDLEREGKLSAEKREIDGDITQWHFERIDTNEDDDVLTASDKAELEAVVKKLGSFTAKMLEDLSHMDTPWQVTERNKTISYKLVFYRDDEISKMVE